MRRLLVSAALFGVLALPALLRPAASDDAEIHVGSVLVADREMADPNFYQTAILIAKYDEQGTLGIIVNRRTDVPISRALEKWSEAKGRVDPVFIGGPVGKSAVLGLVRSRQPLDHSLKIAGDLHLVTDKTELQKMLAAPAAPTPLRIYFGYAGWGPDQLESEIEDGAWHIFPHDPAVIFDSEPDTLWLRLIKKTETQIAALPR